MAQESRIQARQDVFSFMRDVRDGWECRCFHGRLDGINDGGQPLLCIDAPWWCPRVDDCPTPGKPPLCNTGVRYENLDHTKQG